MKRGMLDATGELRLLCDADCAACACDATPGYCDVTCPCDPSCPCLCDTTYDCDEGCESCDIDCACLCDETTACDDDCDHCDPECGGCFSAAVWPSLSGDRRADLAPLFGVFLLVALLRRRR